VTIAKYKAYENLPDQISHLVKRQTVEGATHSMPVLLSTSMTPSFYDWFHQVQHVPGSTSLLILKQHSHQTVKFEVQVYFFISSLGNQS